MLVNKPIPIPINVFFDDCFALRIKNFNDYFTALTINYTAPQY